MDFFESANDVEKYLRQKCADNFQPFSGGLELTPECNLNCKFCYVHQNKLNRCEEGEILTATEWLRIIDEAYDMGIYSLLITGGEPLLHPEFKDIYAHIADKGIGITLNSNGTLMNEEWMSFFGRYGCRRFNISLYGINNETYEKLCGIKDGFDRVSRTLTMLKDNGFAARISVSVVPDNIDQIQEIDRFAATLGIPVQFASYMFPASRKGVVADAQYRLSPEQAADSAIHCFHLKNPNADYEASCRFSLSRLKNPISLNNPRKGFMCYAGKSDFWLSWNGQMRPCGMFYNPLLSYDLKKHSFTSCWNQLVTDTQNSSCKCKDCLSCNMRDLCQTCPAACYAETGSMDKRPEYLCEMTKSIVKKCRDVVAEATYAVPLVSVIVPIYNAEQYLRRCIDSILCQTLHALEVILVDDGSTDYSAEICREYQENDIRVKVIHQPNKGVSAARNTGINASTTPWIIFCDSDDYMEPDFCKVMYHKILSRSTTLVTSNTWTGEESNHKIVQIGFEYENPDYVPIKDAKNNVLFAYVWNKIYSSKLIKEHGLHFDEKISYNEDLKFNEEYCGYCTDASFITVPLFIHLNHETGLAVQGLEKKGMKLEDLEVDGKVIISKFKD